MQNDCYHSRPRLPPSITRITALISFINGRLRGAGAARLTPPPLAREAQAALAQLAKYHRSKPSKKVKIRSLIASHYDELHETRTRYGGASWRFRVVRFLHSSAVQQGLLLLLLLDVVVVFVELFLEAEWPACRYASRDAISCCVASAAAHAVDDAHGSAAAASHHSLCESPLVEARHHPVGCDEHKYPAIHTAHTALFGVSVAILSVFQVELLVMLLALGVLFLRNPLYVLDILVVSVSLTIEIVGHSAGQIYGEFAHAIVIARIWRFIRIGHGIWSTTHEYDHEKMEHYLEEVSQKIRKISSANGANLRVMEVSQT